MAAPRWDIRTEAARMIGKRVDISDDYIKIRETLRAKFPGVQICTIRCSIGWVMRENRKDERELKNGHR